MVDQTLVDTTETIGDLSQLEKDLSQAVSSNTSLAKPAAKTQQLPSNDSLPAKLRGKTLEEVAEMYANLESAYGRQANDLGTQRKMTDRLLDLKRETDLGNNSSTPKVEIKSSELLENPTEALERFSQARDAKHAEKLAAMEQQIAANAFVTAHPDYQDYANNAEFTAWVQGSPIRLRAAQAAQAGDWSVAGDLLTEFKAGHKSSKVDEQNETVQTARTAAKSASFESSSQGSAGAKKGGKTYRRVDLMRLRAERPDSYYSEDFQAEILRAYNEGRVK